ncbi:MAG TPA: SCO family protein [Polyangiaceae bacterium]|nr:SCO family protein [Polyangiaceae bacterium]
MKASVWISVAALLGAMACEQEARPSPRSVAAPSSEHESLPAGTTASGAPLYDLRLTLSAHDGRQVGLAEFRGHPVLISMFYGSCAYACPTLLSDVKRIERQLPTATREELRVLLVSFDAANDTPARLTELVAAHGLDARRWLLTRASDSDALTLAAALGIKYRKLPAGGFNHTSLITLLAPDGKIVAQSEGLNRDNAVITRWLANRS